MLLLLTFLLVALASLCGAVGSCVLKHKNGSVTLQWNFSPEIALRPVDISCDQNTFREFFHQTKFREDTSYQSQHFRGRVQADVSALRDGVLRVHISPVLQEDSGLYSCTFYSSNGQSTSHCRLPVSAAPGPTQESPEGPPEGPPGGTLIGSSRQRAELGLLVFAGLMGVVIVLVLLV